MKYGQRMAKDGKGPMGSQTPIQSMQIIKGNISASAIICLATSRCVLGLFTTTSTGKFKVCSPVHLWIFHDFSTPVLQPSRLCPCNRIATDAPGLAVQMGHRARWRSFPEFEVPLHHLPGAPGCWHGRHGRGPAANARPVMGGDQVHLRRRPPGGAIRHRASGARGGAAQQLLQGQAAAGETGLGRHGGCNSKTKNREARVVR